MREFKNVETEEHAQKILTEFNAVWDVREHYSVIDMYSYSWKEAQVADFKYKEKLLILY